MTACGRAVLVLVLAGVQVLSFTVLRAQDRWSVEQYTSESGLLQNRVHGLERDGLGGLIIGTEGGLVRFDGLNFDHIGIAAPEGLRPSRVLDILPVATGGFVVRDAGSRQYLYRDGRLLPITADAPTRRPISRFSGAATNVDLLVRAMDPDSVMAGKSAWAYSVRMIPLGGGQWCTRTEHEMMVYQDSLLLRRFPVPAGRWSHLVKMNGQPYVFDENGRAHAADVGTGRVRPTHMRGFPVVDPRQGAGPWRMSWGGDDNTVVLFAANRVYDIKPSEHGDTLVATLLDIAMPADCRIGSAQWLERDRVLAVGTDTKGLFIYRRHVMRTQLCDVTMDGVNNAYTVQVPFGEKAVLSCTRGQARIFDKDGCSDVRPPMRTFDETAIVLDRKGRYWYGRSDTLLVFDTRSGTERAMAEGLRPLCFLEEGDTMLVGTAKGILAVVGTSVRVRHPLNEMDLAFRPIALRRFTDGALWMATCSGVYRAYGGGWEVVPGLAGVCARTLAEVDGTFFIGTYGSGMFMHRDDRLLQLPKDEQGFLSHVHAFMHDQAGFLWMSTNQGLFRMRRSDLDAWVKDPSQRIHYAYYGKRAGIANPEFNGGCDPPFVRTSDGWASFPTMDGLVWFRPEEVPDAFPTHPIVVERIELDGEQLEHVDGGALPWGHRELVLHFSLAYWGDPENARVEYSVDGIDDGRWKQLPPGRREVRLGTLPAGEPMVRIRKVGAGLRGDRGSVVLKFKVLPPLFLRAWFVVLCCAAAAFLFYLTLRFNAARLRRKNMQLEKKVRERTAELTDANAILRRSLEMKEMLVSIISHDIVTPLRFIARVSSGASRSMRGANTEHLGETLDDLARASDRLQANAQDMLDWVKRQDGRIALRPRNVALHLLVEEVIGRERERASEKGVRVENDVPLDDVLFVDRNVLTIVLQNLIGNALTYTEFGEVRIAGHEEGGGYVFMLSDTGPGMTDAALAHAKRLQRQGALGAMNHEGERDVQGLGLLIVADLLELLGGGFTIVRSTDEGTSIRVELGSIS